MGNEMSIEQEEQKGSIFKNRNFLFLFIAALFSAPGYYVYIIGVEWLMLTINDNRFFFGMLFMAASIPRLLFLTTGGIVADRFNKRTIIFISDITRALFIIILIVFILYDAVTPYHLIALSALFGIADAFSYPALSSLTPVILKEDQLQRGNSFIQMTAQISPILGPALGGSLIALLGFTGVFSVACIMLLLSAIAVLFIRLKEQENEEEKPSPLTDLKEGFQYARKNELIISIVILAFFLNFFFAGPLTMGIPIIIKDVFHGDVVGLATVQTSMGIGALLGAILLAAVQLRRPGFTLVCGLIALGVVYALTGASIHLYITAFLVAMMGFMTNVINIPLITMLQRTTEKRMLGRMMSFFMTVSTGLVPVSYLVTSLLIAAGVGMQTIMITSGIVVTLLAVFQLRNKKILYYEF